MLLKLGVVGESPANVIGGALSPLVTLAHFFKVLGGLAIVNLVLAILVTAKPQDLFFIPNIQSIATLYGGLALILLWHEFGHCAAARRLGIRVDGMGVGVYLVFPAFFSGISLVNILPVRERVLVYSAGFQFQLMLGVLIGTAYLALDTPMLRTLFLANLSTIMLNFVPVLHLDGYRILVEMVRGRAAQTQRVVGYACAALTFIVMGCFVFALSRNLILMTQAVVARPNASTIVPALFTSVLLLLLLLAAPKWLRRPRG